ncbi:MAG: AbrB/MazE/SpoVT family DNA-binding domain-containing protein [Clostridia bacterium]
MKSTGIVRRVDELGRIVIPIELRNKLKIAEKDPIEIYVDGSSIVLKKYEETCVFCGSNKNVVEYKEKLICTKCAQNISTMSDNIKK